MNTATATAATLTAATVDYTEMVLVDAHAVFPEVVPNPGERQVKMRKHRHQDCLPSNPDYIPDEGIFGTVFAWQQAPRQPRPLGLVGETGTGKTEMALYLADRLNLPLRVVKVTPGLTAAMLEGGYELVTDNGQVVSRRVYGAAVKAYRDGGILLLDEVDKCSDDLATALHLLVEGKPWSLESFGGEVVMKHPQCYIITTSNTTGEGGHIRYTSSRKMDAALRSRIGWLQTAYPPKEHEVRILSKKYPKLPTGLVMDLVETANDCRDLVLGPNRDGHIDDPIGGVFSTRVLVDWGFYIMAFGLKKPLRASLDFVFSGSLDEADGEPVKAALQRRWADKLDLPLGDLLKVYAPSQAASAPKP